MSQVLTDDITDERTEQEKAATWGFIVGNSDWGDERLFVVRPVKEREEAYVIMDVMKERSDLKQVRYVGGKQTKSGLTYCPRLGEKDRVHIYNYATFLPNTGGCVHVGARVSLREIRGNIESSIELSEGVTEGVTGGCALLLDEWRVSELLPEKDKHVRDEHWRAWVLGDDNIREVLKMLKVESEPNRRHEMLQMMREYQTESFDYFTGSKIVDVEIVSNLTREVRGVLLTLTS